MIEYRSATAADAPGIADVMRAVWPDDSADRIRIAGVLSHLNHATRVAVDGDHILGFVDGFTTLSEDNLCRLEVDLLAVAPVWQGQGIGRELARRLTEATADVDFARALIRIGNLGSQRAFAAAGYAPETSTSWLFVSAAEGRGIDSLDGLHLIPVETFSYAGLWLEGQRTRENLRLARQLEATGLVGAVIPAADVAALEPEMLGYQRVGEYRWWRHG